MAVHTVATVITAKDVASLVFKKLEKTFGKLTGRSSTLAKVFLALGASQTAAALTAAALSAALSAVGAIVGAVAFGIGAVLSVLKLAAIATLAFGAALTALSGILAGSIARCTKYAMSLQGIYRAYMSIAQEAAPAMLQALKEASSFMVEEGVLLKEYNRAFMLVGETLTERLPEALRYLSKAALATGDDVGRMVNALVTGIGRLSTRFRTNIGVTVTLQEAVVRATEMFGKEAEELTYLEKQAGMLDLALKKLEIRTRNMPEVLMTAQQQALAFKTGMKDLAGLIGRIFLPAAQAFYRVLNKVVGALTGAVSEGGLLYPVLRKLAAAATALFRIFADLGPAISDSAVKGFNELANRMMQAAWDAFEWGANIVNNLAIGMTQAAGTAMVAALNFLTRMLTGWMGPGSAPRFLPDIGRWGSAAFTEYLKGFALAEFKVLEEVQAPLWGALKVLADMGEMSGKAAGMMFIELSYAMTEALDKFRTTGEVSAEIFGKLEAVGGEYGEGLAELFRRELKLVTAIKAVTAAEQQLADARRREEESGKKLSKSVREYNRLLREGASPEILRAKLAQAKGAYRNLVVARAEAEQAEKDLELAEKRRKAEQEQVTLQQKLLRQLIKLGQIWVDVQEEGADGDGVPGYELPEPTPPYLEPIDVAFEDLVARIRARFEQLWADLRADWEASGVGEIFAELQAKWDELVVWWEGNGPIIRKWIADTATAVYTWMDENIFQWVLDEWDKWVVWWETDGPLIVKAFGVMTGDLDVSWKGFWNTMWHTTQVMWKLIKIVISGGMEILRKTITLGAQVITGDWRGAWETIKGIGKTAWDTINKLSGGRLYEFFDTTRIWLYKVRKAWDNLQGALTRIDWSSIRFSLEKDVIEPLRVMAAIIDGSLRRALDWFHGKLEDTKRVLDLLSLELGFVESMRAIADVINTSLRWALDWVHGKLEGVERTFMALGGHVKYLVGWLHNLRDAFNDLVLPDWLKPGSPAPLETALLGIGDALVKMPSMPLLLSTEGGNGAGRMTTIYVTNNFGRDSVRSDRDIRDIAEATQRSLELRGIRERIA